MLLITEGLLPFLDPLIQRIVERTSENEIAVLMLLLTNDVVALLSRIFTVRAYTEAVYLRFFI